MKPARRIRIHAFEHHALARVDRQNHFCHGGRPCHEALGRVEIDGALIGKHRIGLASHPL